LIQMPETTQPAPETDEKKSRGLGSSRKVFSIQYSVFSVQVPS
jgi:hypothetical protein